MGTRSADKLKEIEAIRSGLDGKLAELERRFPLAGYGRKGAAMLAGSGVLSSVGALAWRRMRSKRAGNKKKKRSEPAGAPVVVNVVPKSATAIAVAGIAVWAGVRLYETYTKNKSAASDNGSRPGG